MGHKRSSGITIIEEEDDMYGMTGTVATHDAQKILADFRDHLARHDKPLAFLFGAGTSCAVRVTNWSK